MELVYTREFLKQFGKLPPPIQQLYEKQESLFRNNWRDARLHAKKLIGYPYHFSFRVTRSYRVIFIFNNLNRASFLSIVHRKDAYR